MAGDMAGEPLRDDSERGSVLLVFVFLTVVLGTSVAFLMTNTRTAWSDFDSRFESDRALQEAIGQLEIARWEVRSSTYTNSGSNDALQEAIGTGVLPDSGVQVAEVTGAPGWYTITASADHRNGTRIVQQTVRETESLSSYNMFVWEHPIGISGQPRGSIHTNRHLEFFFPDGLYRDSVTAVEGHQHVAGATEDNTTMLGAFDSASDPVQLDFMIDQDSLLNEFRANVEADFLIPEEHEADIRLYRVGSEQWVEIKEFGKPYTEQVTKTRNKKREIGGHYETVTVSEPIKEQQTTYVEKPVYKDVWVETEGGGSIAGSNGSSGYYEQVIDYYETVEKTVWVTVGYQDVTKDIWVPEYEYWTEEYQKTAYRNGPLIKTTNQPVPENGVIFSEGKIKALRGQVVGRVTVGTADNMLITGNLKYVDGSGGTAFLNGSNPDLPYEPNPNYDNNAVLGLVSAGDVIYSRKVPENLEINASVIALNGRVGIEGVVLAEDGSISKYNQMYDQWGRKKNKWKFDRNSIRRLGGVSSARRPIDTVVDGGFIASGFKTGVQIFDGKLVTSPPPLIPAKDEPTFTERIVLQ